jgi:hypothetical protein
VKIEAQSNKSVSAVIYVDVGVGRVDAVVVYGGKNVFGVGQINNFSFGKKMKTNIREC